MFPFDTKSGKLPPVTPTISATYRLGVEMTSDLMPVFPFVKNHMLYKQNLTS